jgi:hypothetical protein
MVGGATSITWLNAAIAVFFSACIKSTTEMSRRVVAAA